MKWIGLTGGISAGKSTVAKKLRTLGYEVLDADQVSREVTSINGEALPEIFKTFGLSVKKSDGSLDRVGLGALVFGHEDRLRLLENIIHPLVQKRVLTRRDELKAQGARVVFYDVPLLYEKKMENKFDAVVLVYCREDQQIQRLMARSGLSREDSEKRIRSQISIEEKKERTPYVVDNTKDISHLDSELQRVLRQLAI